MPDKPRESRQRDRDAPATFPGDSPGGGTSLGADLGRDGTSTPTGDIAGGGEPGSLVDRGAGTIIDRDAVPTGGAGAATSEGRGREPHGENAQLPPPAHDLPRSATEMAPGIPAGSGAGIDEALQQPDTDLGGGVAGDTTPTGKGARSSDEVKTEDKGRTTL